jgi:GTP-binding protein HflX
MDDLLKLLSDWLQQDMFEVHLKMLMSDGRSIAFCHEHGAVLSKTVNGEVMDIVVRLSPADAGRFKEESGIHSLVLA